MGVLSTEELIYGLENGQPLTPYGIHKDVIDEHIKSIQYNRTYLRTDSPECKKLAKHLREPLEFIRQEMKLELSKSDIYVLPFPLCMAYSQKSDTNPIIVIGSGLINLIANSILRSQLQSMLPTEFDSYYLTKFRKDMSATELFTNALFLLDLNYYRFNKSLLNIHALMPAETLKDSKMAINGALLFVLLHELGHHKLMHHNGKINTIRPIEFDYVLKEKSSRKIIQKRKKQEMEADQFALDSIIDKAKIIGTFWHQNAINFFMQMELISGRYIDDEHPMAINRSAFSDSLRAEWGDEHGIEPRQEFFKNTAERFKLTRKHKSKEINKLIETPYEICIEILREINEALGFFNFDITSLWETPNPNWLDVE